MTLDLRQAAEGVILPVQPTARMPSVE